MGLRFYKGKEMRNFTCLGMSLDFKHRQITPIREKLQQQMCNVSDR